ncbi:MAG TPA: oligoendopeptidase F, partial [Rhodobacteraceae bacterium]|nr:oligoendopeptidase F [Paracoccaceae bacterium]
MNSVFPDQKLSRDLRDAASGSNLGNLPEWDLTHLYSAEDSPELTRDLSWLNEECINFAKDYENKLAGLSANEMLECIVRYEKIQSISGRIMSFAGLRYYQITTDANRAKFIADMQGQITDFSTPLVFFSLEMNCLNDDVLQKMLASNADLARYKPVLDRMRAMKPYQLSNEMEKFLHDQSVVGATAWNRLFDETCAALEFDVDGQILNLEGTANLLSDPDRSTRQKAAEAFAKTLRENLTLFARITNTLAKEKEIEDRWRELPTPQSGRHLANDVEPEVVQALRDAVVAAYPKLSHRYYALKAKWMGLEKLEVWDRNAPLPDSDDATIHWEEARSTVTEAYATFSPKMAELAEPFFDQGWIDA